MSTIIDRLITEFSLRGEQYVRQAGEIVGATRRVAGSIAGAAKQAAGFGLAAGGVAAGGIVGLGVAAFNAYAELEELKMGLASVAGSSAEAERQLKRLKDVARLPGLDLGGAIQMSVSLQAGEMAAADAERAIKAFGNALATVGRSSELDGVVYGIGQVWGSSTILAEDLNIIKERVPQVGQALKRLYGTMRPDELAKLGIAPREMILRLIQEMEKLPQVSGGAKNSVVNLGVAIRQAMATAGGAIAKVVVPVLERVTSLIEWLDSSGKIEAITQSFTRLFSTRDIGNKLVYTILWTVAAIERVPGAIRSAAKWVGDSMTWMQRVWVGTINVIREGAIIAASAMMGIFVGGALLNGMGAIVKMWQTITTATKLATVAQVVYQAVMTGGANTGKILTLAAATAITAYAALSQAIPKMAMPAPFEMPALSEIGRETDERMAEFHQFLRDQDALTKQGKPGEVAGAGRAAAGKSQGKLAGDVANAAMTADARESWADSARGLRDAMDRNTDVQERLVELNRQLQGGGAFAEAATSELAVARATGRDGGGGGTDLDMAVQLIARHVRATATGIFAVDSRRMREAGAI